MVISCSKDDDDDDVSGYQYSFIDQNLQGEIDGKAWVFVAGNAEESSFTEGHLSIDLYPEALDNPCDWVWDVDKIIFEIPAEEAIHELYFSWGSEDAFTVTFVKDSVVPMNYIAIQGAVEIVNISEMDDTITCRMDVKIDDNTYANGNFSIALCE